MRSLFRLVVLCTASLLLLACFRIERRSNQVDGIPPAMLGAWSGGWSSSSNTGSGSVALRVQMFEGRPVLQLDAAHPCLVSGAYELRTTGPHLELWRSGVEVFSADLDLNERRLQGQYHCEADLGEWNADWTGDLPPLGDVSGLWVGTFATAAPRIERPFTMQIEQAWSNGLLAVTGEIVVDGIGTGFPITSGQVAWIGDRFDLLLRGQQLGVQLAVQGLGELGPPTAAQGLLLVQGGGAPVAAGTWTAQRLPD